MGREIRRIWFEPCVDVLGPDRNDASIVTGGALLGWRFVGNRRERQQVRLARCRANGTVFISLEDETGVVQVICWKSLRDAQRKELLNSRLLAVHGRWQREGT